MDLNSKQEKILTSLQLFLAGQTDVSEQDLLTAAKSFRMVYSCTDSEFEQVMKEIESRRPHRKDVGCGITDDYERVPWFLNTKKTRGEDAWNGYYNYLLYTGNFTPTVLASMGTELDEIMDYLGDPCAPMDYPPRKGLVIGDVQSGKTAT